jgi:hypothetical protein
MADDLLKEQIKTQIEVTRDFTKELVDANKILRDLKNTDGEILAKLQNGITDKIEKRLSAKINMLYWKIVASFGVIAAIFGFIVNLFMNKGGN